MSFMPSISVMSPSFFGSNKSLSGKARLFPHPISEYEKDAALWKSCSYPNPGTGASLSPLLVLSPHSAELQRNAICCSCNWVNSNTHTCTECSPTWAHTLTYCNEGTWDASRPSPKDKSTFPTQSCITSRNGLKQLWDGL